MKYVLVLMGVLLTSACVSVPIPTRTNLTPTVLPTASRVMVTPGVPTPSIQQTVVPTESPTTLPITYTMPIAYEHSPRALVIQADVWKALSVPRDMHVATFRLYGDGLVVWAGESAPMSSGLDAVVRVGRLSESEIQNLLVSFYRAGFFSLKDVYTIRTAPPDLPTAFISIYAPQAKTVRVDAFGREGTPQAFSDLLKQITQTIPSDAQTFTPSDGYLETTDAGAVSSFSAKDDLKDWTILGIRLADAIDGITISGNNFSPVRALIAGNLPSVLYREGERVYRVRFAPNLPRAPHLTSWVGAILDAPREFDGRTFEIVGYFRGWDILGEVNAGPPVTRSDWVIADDSGAIYVTGGMPQGLDPASRTDAWSVVRLTAKVVYVRLGTSYLEAKSVQVLSRNTPAATLTPTITATPTITTTPTLTRSLATLTLAATRTVSPTMISTSGADAAIALVKLQFPQVANIKSKPGNVIGASTDITVIAPRQDAWWLVFWEGSGDCMAGCINHHYYYFVVEGGRATLAGEYARTYNPGKNSYETTGAPMWGVPKQ